MPLVRNVPITDSPSRLGNMRSTISTSYSPSSAIAKPSSPSLAAVGDMADLAECLDQIVGSVAVVLDDKKAHGDPIRLRFGRPAKGASRDYSHKCASVTPIPVNSVAKFIAGLSALSLNPLVIREGVAGLARHPLNDPTPAGATDARVGVLEKDRDGHEARPVEVDPPAGATDASGTSPNLTCSPAADRQSDEAGVVTRFHPQQHGAFAFGTGAR